MIKKIVHYVTVLLLILTCIIFIVYSYQRYAIVPHYRQKVSDIAHDRLHEINAFLTQQEKNAVALAQEPLVCAALAAEKIDEETEKAITALCNSHQEKMAFRSIILINATGTIRYSSTQQDMIGQVITHIQHAKSSLSGSYERAIMSLTPDFSYFNFNDVVKSNALFITIPILVEKKLVGALAYQIDQEKIYLITNQYIGLEKTGEVVLARKDGSFILFVSPSRNDPDLSFKKIPLFTEKPPAMQPAVLGQDGSGIALDHRDKKVIGAWKFIPKLDWGILVKIDYDELIHHHNILKQLCLLLSIFCILFIVLTMYMHRAALRRKMHATLQLGSSHEEKQNVGHIPALLKNPLFIMLLIFSGLTLKNGIKCIIKKSSMLEKAQKQAAELCSNNGDAIDNILDKIVFVGQAINDDLAEHHLAMDDIATRLKRDTLENDSIQKITLLLTSPTNPHSLHQYVITEAADQQNSTYTDTQLDETEKITIEQSTWYTQAIAQGTSWTMVTQTSEHKQSGSHQMALYAQKLVDKKQQTYGVIAIEFSLGAIIKTAQYSGIGQTGYSLILTQDGLIIFHPTQSVMEQHITLLNYAQSQGNGELATIAEKIIRGKPITASYTSESDKEVFWIHSQPMKVNNWIIASVFSQDEVGLQSDTIRHYFFWILVWLTIALLILGALLYVYDIISFTHYAVIANVILLIALASAWHIIQITTTTNREVRAIITDQSNLNKFLNDLHDESQRKHEIPPINIPCGILVSSLSMIDPDHIAIAGYVWNKYNSKQTEISREMRFPQASKVTFGSPTISVADEEETVTWNVQATLFQEQNYTKYPFDQLHIQIILEHKDMEKNTLLTPDLASYKKISPESLPGLDKEFALPGFSVEQTFFEYHKIEQTTNYGLQDFGKVTDNYQLVYNVILNRNLLNPFVLYLIPLLVILFSLFSTLLVEGLKSEPLSVLGGYTGLFFALIVLQRSLREQYPTGGTLYLEYAFFYTYLTIILLIIHTILMSYYKHWESYQKKSLYVMRILFWSFQLISWLITTLVVFY